MPRASCLFASHGGGGGAQVRGEGWLEVQVDCFRWRPLAKRALAKALTKANGCDLDFGFALEGRLDEELPERLLGAARIAKLDISLVPSL